MTAGNMNLQESVATLRQSFATFRGQRYFRRLLQLRCILKAIHLFARSKTTSDWLSAQRPKEVSTADLADALPDLFKKVTSANHLAQSQCSPHLASIFASILRTQDTAVPIPIEKELSLHISVVEKAIESFESFVMSKLGFKRNQLQSVWQQAGLADADVVPRSIPHMSVEIDP